MKQTEGLVSRCIKEKTKFMTNNDTTDNIQIDCTEKEKVTNYGYLGQTIAID